MADYEIIEHSVLPVLDRDGQFLGSCFAFYEEAGRIYFATCAHVVGKRQSGELAVVDQELAAILVYTGSPDGPDDLAVLSISRESVPEAVILSVTVDAKPNDEVTVIGAHTRLRNLQIEPISAKLYKLGILRSRSRANYARVWTLDTAEGEQISLGNSGGPVLNREGSVIGIVIDRQEGGLRGTAISIAELAKFWREAPRSLKERLSERLPDADEVIFTRQPRRKPYQTDRYLLGRSATDVGGAGYYCPVLFAETAEAAESDAETASDVFARLARDDDRRPIGFVAPFAADIQETLLSIIPVQLAQVH